ncbi:MAG: type I secretion C-terminal target domain-containing protein, partial [Pseudomonadota bacterium]|nr:type I secretion C-terminal target domain-containing protein [Pseudomonadota bacterium]
TVNGQTVIVPLVDDNDIIDGGAGDDYINGGIGDDIIMGGEGADILFGDQGVDTFLYQALSDAGDTIMDFETGPGGDILNLTDVLEGFDAQLDDINDFMQIVHNGGSDELHINADGQGNDFVTLVTFDGGLGGLGISDLVNNGQIVTDQSIVI